MATEIPAHLFHDFPDRAHRNLLEQHRGNLRELLNDAVPNATPLLDIDRAEQMRRQFEWPDWRRSENDLLFRVPRLDQQGVAAVCVLAEHQSQPDQAAALRTLGEALLLWFSEWRTWLQGHQRGQRLRLSLVVPVVFHTGAEPWEGSLSLAEAFDMSQLPAALTSFVPVWQPALFDLPARSAESLLSDPGPWHRSLAVARQIREEAAPFAECYTRALESLIPLRSQDLGRWQDLMRVLVSYVVQRRPQAERRGLFDQALTLFHDTTTREEVASMAGKIDEFWVGREERLRSEGRNEGRLEGVQEMIIRQARAKWGASPPMEEIVHRTVSPQRLEALSVRLLTAESWADLLAG